MSISNPFDPMWPWRVDPDNRQNRASGPCITRQMTEEEKIKYGIAVEKHEEDVEMAHMTKEVVKRMADNGMSIPEIAEQFAPVYPNMKMSMLKAKIHMLLKEKDQDKPEKLDKQEKKKPGRPRKEIPAQVEETSEPVATEEQLPSTIEITDEELADIHKRQPYIEQEEISVKEVAQKVREEISKAAVESLDKIKLRQAVDEMMELVPDNINHPAHYTIGKVEVIDYIQDKMTPEMFEGFCVGNAMKYLSRYRLKGGLEDLKKAEWYLNRLIKMMETA